MYLLPVTRSPECESRPGPEAQCPEHGHESDCDGPGPRAPGVTVAAGGTVTVTVAPRSGSESKAAGDRDSARNSADHRNRPWKLDP
jgi:hypothetical protein